MSYDNFTKIDPEFIQIFNSADFGRRGNPLNYHSDGHDIVDLMSYLNKNTIKKFTIAAAIPKISNNIIKRLEDFVSKKSPEIQTMLTYHHYFNNLDISKLSKDFNDSIKNHMRFSKKITLSLLGDKYQPGQDLSKAEEVVKTFDQQFSTIFEGITLTKKENNKIYLAEYNGLKSEIFIPSVDTRVYPLGRFKNYLSEKGIFDEYTKNLEKSFSDYACPDLIKWPGIIIEPDGSLNLCGSFEAINCNKAVISNIFTKSFSEVKKELMSFHKGEMKWFIQNLDEIIAGKISTCKIKNNCYK